MPAIARRKQQQYHNFTSNIWDASQQDASYSMDASNKSM
jgi:hypothetical protein